MGIAAAAADRAHRLDRDPAQDIAEQRRVAIDGAAGAAKACLFAQLPRSARDAYRVDRPGEAEVRFLLADEDRGAAIRSEEHTSELQSLMRISYAVFCLKKKNQTIDHKQRPHNSQSTLIDKVE